MRSIIVTCPSCGRKGKAAALGKPVRCGECGKEFKAGDRGAGRRTLLLGVLSLISIAIVGYFSIFRARRNEAEEKAREAEEARRRISTEPPK
jgi:uncharacterized protein (DUF983 family)